MSKKKPVEHFSYPELYELKLLCKYSEKKNKIESLFITGTVFSV